MQREDLSQYLIHWTKGQSYEEAYNALLNICFDGVIHGGTRGVTGGESVICFTETPAKIFHSNTIGEFKPFGIQFKKIEIFKKGGLPVIYQPNSDLKYLDPSIHWRHVEFSIGSNGKNRNFTWQREWRVKTKFLKIESPATIIVPDREWVERIVNDFSSEYLKRGQEDNYDRLCCINQKYANKRLYFFEKL
ncbi:hypothetical protein, partial [Chromobacterium violaceum]